MLGNARTFVDTNIVIYSINSEGRKRAICRKLLESHPIISVQVLQVLNESANVMRRQLKMTWTEISEALTALRQVCKVAPLTEVAHDIGLKACERYQLSLYDSMLPGSALEHGCTDFVTHEMHDGLVLFDSLTVKYPFQ